MLPLRSLASPGLRPRRLALAALLVASVTGGACGHSVAPAPTPTPAFAADAAQASAPAAGRCAPWAVPAAAPAVTSDTGDTKPGRRATPSNAARPDLCETADSNLARAEQAILAEDPATPAGDRAAPAEAPRNDRGRSWRAWDHTTPPERLDRVAQRFAFTGAERARLREHGFVVLARVSDPTYAWAFHEVYQSELPVYVSADAILHAVYASNDHLIADLEAARLVGLLARTLSEMHCALAAATNAYPPEIAWDLDLYLTVARTLLADAPVPSVLATDAEAAALVSAAKQARGLASVELFGRTRLVDWSQFLPRGHYADATPAPESGQAEAPRPSLAPYFRASMWLARLELNLVTRSSRSSQQGALDPRETPREAIAALALADLAERAQVTASVDALDRAFALLAGRREDVSIADLLRLKRKAGITRVDLGAFEALKAAIGSDFQRSARLHPMAEGAAVLPAIATFLGPRVVADAAAFRPLVHTEVADRYLVGAGDVAYVLGLDRGKVYLADELARHPSLGAQLDLARASLAGAKDTGDLYGAWLGALRGAATLPAGVLPSFMRTPAYDDLRMNTLIAGYGQLRHNYVLMAGQAYDEGGCEIPDGWVEPLPRVYDQLTRYAERGATVLRELDPRDELGAGRYFAELGKLARVLGAIARSELAGQPLSLEARRFLSMVVEMSPGGTGGPPTYTGWYFDLFRGREHEALADAGFVADYATSAWKQQVVYAGATGPRMAAFVVDTGGPPRVMVGPVAHAYALVGPLEQRYTDASVGEAPGKQEPWSVSYTAPPPPTPAFAFAASLPSDPPARGQVTFLFRSPKALGQVTFEALDHHRVPLAHTVRTIVGGPAALRVRLAARGAEGVRVRVGEYSAEAFASGPSTQVLVERSGATMEPADLEEVAK